MAKISLSSSSHHAEDVLVMVPAMLPEVNLLLLHIADGALAADHRCSVKVCVVSDKLHPGTVGDHLDDGNQTACGGTTPRCEHGEVGSAGSHLVYSLRIGMKGA